jgi:hypothetical protein
VSSVYRRVFRSLLNTRYDLGGEADSRGDLLFPLFLAVAFVQQPVGSQTFRVHCEFLTPCSVINETTCHKASADLSAFSLVAVRMMMTMSGTRAARVPYPLHRHRVLQLRAQRLPMRQLQLPLQCTVFFCSMAIVCKSCHATSSI